MSNTEHRKAAPNKLACAVITVSDTRTNETDKSGKLMNQLLKDVGHEVVAYTIVKDEKLEIRNVVLTCCQDPSIDAILLNGGTGLALRDVTIETISPLFEKEITGFGELFRMLSYSEDIGSAAILSRASAGIIQHKVVFATPGSTGAVRLAMNRLIIPELGHIVSELRKDIS